MPRSIQSVRAGVWLMIGLACASGGCGTVAWPEEPFLSPLGYIPPDATESEPLLIAGPAPVTPAALAAKEDQNDLNSREHP